MKPSSTLNRNATTPPLARDAQGNSIELPEGAVGWRLRRHTGGRPRTVLGTDGLPVRLGLDATPEDVLDMFGDGTYRLEAIDADGEPIDYVTTLTVGDYDDARVTESSGGPATGRGYASSDLRFALEANVSMARSLSDAVRVLAEAQADWTKGLAVAKALPRNVATPMSSAAVPSDAAIRNRHEDDDDEDESDEDDDDDDDESDEDDNPSGPGDFATMLMTTISTVLPMFLETKALDKQAKAAAQSTATPAPAPTTAAVPPPSMPEPMGHLVAILRRLTPREGAWLSRVLHVDKTGETSRILTSMTVDEAVAWFHAMKREVLAERKAATAASPAPAEGAAPQSSPPSFLEQVTAVQAKLTPEERARVMALIPTLGHERVAELKTTLVRLSVDDAVAWVRANLDQLAGGSS